MVLMWVSQGDSEKDFLVSKITYVFKRLSPPQQLNAVLTVFGLKALSKDEYTSLLNITYKKSHAHLIQTTLRFKHYTSIYELLSYSAEAMYKHLAIDTLGDVWTYVYPEGTFHNHELAQEVRHVLSSDSDYYSADDIKTLKMFLKGKTVNELTRKERKALVYLLRHLSGIIY